MNKSKAIHFNGNIDFKEISKITPLMLIYFDLLYYCYNNHYHCYCYCKCVYLQLFRDIFENKMARRRGLFIKVVMDKDIQLGWHPQTTFAWKAGYSILLKEKEKTKFRTRGSKKMHAGAERETKHTYKIKLRIIIIKKGHNVMKLPKRNISMG